MENSIPNNREYPRKEICLGVLFKHGIEWLPADIRDVTVGGISFIAKENIDPGTEVIIIFGDSDVIGDNDVHSVVLRHHVLESYSPPKYLMAVKLTETNAKYVQDILTFLKENGSNIG